jgi:hypothetical protein
VELDAAIECLYEVFAKYELRDRVDGAVPDELIDRLHSNPMGEMDSDDLNDFAIDALYVWGEPEDFKHFLPRLFELAAFDGFESTEPEFLFKRILFAELMGPGGKWTEQEFSSIEEYFRVLWKFELCLENARKYPFHVKNSLHKTESVLRGIAWTVEDISPYLYTWQAIGMKRAYFLLKELFFLQLDRFNRKEQLYHPYEYHDYPQPEKIIAWLKDPATLTSLKDKLAQETNEEKKEYLTKSVDLLQIFQDLQAG